MSDGRTVWWPKDSAWWRREHIVELGEEFGAAGPAVLDWLSCEAKAQNDGGRVKAGVRSCARGCFVEAVTVGHVLSRAVALGALDDFEQAEGRFTARISGWKKDNERGQAAVRKAAQREREAAGSPAVAGDPRDPHGVTERDTSRPVTVGHLTGQDRREEGKTSPHPPQAGEPLSRTSPPASDRLFSRPSFDPPAAPIGRRRRDGDRHSAAIARWRQDWRDWAASPEGRPSDEDTALAAAVTELLHSAAPAKAAEIGVVHAHGTHDDVLLLGNTGRMSGSWLAERLGRLVTQALPARTRWRIIECGCTAAGEAAA